MRLSPTPLCAILCLWLACLCAPARAACGLEQAAPNMLVIKTSAGGGPCDTALLRESLQNAILFSEAAAGGRAGGAGGAGGSFANQQRTTTSALFKLGTAPSASPPPTRLVMPALGAR